MYSRERYKRFLRLKHLLGALAALTSSHHCNQV